MFYCDRCARKHGYPKTQFRSTGKCEICGRRAPCSDVPSALLPVPRRRADPLAVERLARALCSRYASAVFPVKLPWRRQCEATHEAWRRDARQILRAMSRK
jgi:hypothetical protein